MNGLQNETLDSIAGLLAIPAGEIGGDLVAVTETDHRYLRDLKVNLSNSLKYASLSPKESYLLALAVASNEKNGQFKIAFQKLAEKEGATKEEIADVFACVSLMNINNVFYRFRHFTGKEFYETTPAGIKMSIMMNPVVGKEFFELISLSVSALNGCERCVTSHEQSLMQMGTSEQRIYDAVRLASIVKGFLQII